MLLTVQICAVLFGALWRFWDGLDRSQSRLPAALRGVIFFAAALAVCKLTGKTWPLAVYMAGFATLNIVVGHTKWDDWTWQALRFSTFGALTVLPLDDFAHTVYYVAALIFAGVAYPLLFEMRNVLPRWGNLGPDPTDAEGRDRYMFDGPEAYARLPLGAAILGGLAFL